MADMAGYSGNVAVTFPTGFVANVDGWSASIAVDTAVYSTFASQWKNSKLGTGQVTGAITGVLKFNTVTTEPVPSTGGDIDIASFTGSTTLTAETGCTLSGTFNFTNVRMGRTDPNGASEFAADIESDGVVAIAWDETA